MRIKAAMQVVYEVTRAEAWKDTKLVWMLIGVGFYLANFRTPISDQGVKVFYYLLLFSIYISIVAIINDFSDRRQDALLGKEKIVQHWKVSKLVFLLTTLSMVFFILVFLKDFSLGTLFWITLFLFLGIFYSLKPIRFKERGFLGIFVGSLIQRTLPIALFFLLESYWGSMQVVLLFLLSIVGFRSMLVHQIKDFEGDLKTNTKTFAISFGKMRSAKFVRRELLVLEIVALLIFTFYARSVNGYNLFYLFVIYVLAWVVAFWVDSNFRKTCNPLSVANSFPAEYYFVWLPAFVGA